MLRLIPVLASCALAACSAAPVRVEAAQPPAAHRELRDSLGRYLRTAADSGLSGVALVVRNGEVVLAEGFSPGGTLSRGTGFWIGSVTKPITATAILELAEEGRLSLGDTIGRFLDHVPADKRGITIHQLLTHSSGLPSEYAADGVVDRGEAVRSILAVPLRHEPGTAVLYSNDGFSLLAAIVEIASGEPYEQHVEKTVLAPSGMRSSGFWPQPRREQPFASTGPIAPEMARPNWGYRGATGMYSTVDDLHAFTVALRGGRIVSPEMVARAQSARIDRPGNASDIGYGWMISEMRGHRLVTHAGAESGIDHYSWIYIFPTLDLTVILLSNSPEDRARGLVRGLLRLVVPTS